MVIKIFSCIILGYFVSAQTYAGGKSSKLAEASAKPQKKIVQITFDANEANRKPASQEKAKAPSNSTVTVDPVIVPLAFGGTQTEAEVEPLTPSQKERLQKQAEKAKLERQRRLKAEARREEEESRKHASEQKFASADTKNSTPPSLKKLLKKFEKQLANEAAEDLEE